MAVLEKQDDRMAWTLHADTVRFESLLCHLGARQAIELSGYLFSQLENWNETTSFSKLLGGLNELTYVNYLAHCQTLEKQ